MCLWSRKIGDCENCAKWFPSGDARQSASWNRGSGTVNLRTLAEGDIDSQWRLDDTSEHGAVVRAFVVKRYPNSPYHQGGFVLRT
jgi:hypothetical protein